MQSRRLFGTAMKQQCQSRKLRRLEQENFFFGFAGRIGQDQQRHPDQRDKRKRKVTYTSNNFLQSHS
jgi:hypothetical protein